MPVTPLALMRSRFTAYTQKNSAYLIQTWHPDCQAVNWRDSIEESFEHTKWLNLRIIGENSGNHPDEGYVEFVACYQDTHNNQSRVIHEKSRFLRIEGCWYYIDGIHPVTGRNEGCPCGSGKKYKKCCGQ